MVDGRMAMRTTTPTRATRITKAIRLKESNEEEQFLLNLTVDHRFGMRSTLP